jgi:hypothetical protein
MSSHVEPVVVIGFPQEKGVVAEELGVNKHLALWRLTFPLSKESLDACSIYLNIILSICFIILCITYMDLNYVTKLHICTLLYLPLYL